MKKQICIGLVLFVVIVFMGISTYQAQGSNNQEDGVAPDVNTFSSATAKWFFQLVDTSPPYDVGEHVSIALDHTNGTPYISYYEASHQMLQMAKYVGSGGNCGSNNDWACETVDNVGNVGQYSSIAIDPTDNLPIIAYFDTSNGGALKLAVRTVFDWVIATIDDPDLLTAGQYTSLALNSNVKTGISYYRSNFLGNDSLWYAEYVGGGTGNCSNNDYNCELVVSGEKVGKYTSLALDSFDMPHIAFQDGDNNDLMYAHFDGGSWRHRRILSSTTGNPSGKFASLAIDVNNGDLQHIAHYDSVNGTLEYAVFVGPGGNCGMNSYNQYEWQCDVIDYMGTGTNPKGLSMALDGAGYPIIAYQSGVSGLKIARPAQAVGKLIGNCGPDTPFFTWQCDVISLGIGIGQGDYMSLAVNSTGLSTIAYYGNIVDGIGDLRVAYQRLRVFLPSILKNK